MEKLGPHFDEIELLLFESQPSNVLPSKDEIQTLKHLSKIHDVSYNIHLPTDVDWCCDTQKSRHKASDTYKLILENMAPLNPTTCTLHLPMPKKVQDKIQTPGVLETWQDTMHKILSLLVAGIPDPKLISIETLEYPFEYVEELINEFGFSICIDAGHQIKYGYDLYQTFQKHKSKTTLIHLHGVDFSNDLKKDHTSLDKLPVDSLNLVEQLLSDFKGVVSLEIFNLVNLNRSLRILSQLFDNIPDSI